MRRVCSTNRYSVASAAESTTCQRPRDPRLLSIEPLTGTQPNCDRRATASQLTALCSAWGCGVSGRSGRIPAWWYITINRITGWAHVLAHVANVRCSLKRGARIDVFSAAVTYSPARDNSIHRQPRPPYRGCFDGGDFCRRSMIWPAGLVRRSGHGHVPRKISTSLRRRVFVKACASCGPSTMRPAVIARAAVDPHCGICPWGVTLTVGPNYNMPMMASRVPMWLGS
jgi:hypothetical protein